MPNRQIQNLRRTRDLLLPRLLWGQLEYAAASANGAPSNQPGAAPQVSERQTPQGLKARSITPSRTIHPDTTDDESMERAVGAGENIGGHDSWGVAPGWYEPGLWPKIFAMPQSLSLVTIHGIFGTKERHSFVDPDARPRRLAAKRNTSARGRSRRSFGCS